MSMKQNDETQSRWYMVNKDGMATLCADQADAEQEAKDAQEVWPHMGPHRAVQLVEASQAFTASDMATAAAQGFRDGQAAQAAVAAGWVSVDAAMRAAGAGLSNIAFNIAQWAGKVLTPDICASLDKCRREWDAVPRALAGTAPAPMPSPTPQADSQPAQVLAYPPLPDLDGTLWPAIGQHRRAITNLETTLAAKAVDTAVYGLLCAYVDADRAARAPEDSVLEDAARWKFAEANFTYAEFRDGSYFNTYQWPKDESQQAARATVDAARKQGKKS